MKNLINTLLISSVLLLATTSISYAQQGQVSVNQDAMIPQLLELKKDLEKRNKLSDGFTIQIFSGERSRANAVINRYRSTFAAWPATLEYETPNYKVWVGNYASRLAADRALLEIQAKFPAAFIFQPERKK
ncbi:MAG: SPOR domain-containing protein [Gilvibacter sp.]